VHESCSVSVLDGEDIVYVARVATRRLMTVAISVGTRFPAYATSMGRVLLAGLPPAERTAYLRTTRLEPLTRHTVTDPAQLAAVLDQVAEQGFALVDQELEEGLRSIAAPVRDSTGAVAAAVNVSASARRTSESIRTELLPPLLQAAGEIESDLRRTG
jgi:IclR family pca regulon transcriptional regulator